MKGSALFSLLVALLLNLAGCSGAARNLPETPAPTLRPTRTPLGVFPSGAHDGAEKLVTQPSCRAFGWAIDINHPEQPITVRVLADGVEVAQAVADRFRPDFRAEHEVPQRRLRLRRGTVGQGNAQCRAHHPGADQGCSARRLGGCAGFTPGAHLPARRIAHSERMTLFVVRDDQTTRAYK
jgi:hypothetical protein